MIIGEFLHDVVAISKSDAAKNKAHRIANRNTKEARQKRLTAVERIGTGLMCLGIAGTLAGIIAVFMFSLSLWWVVVIWVVVFVALYVSLSVFCTWYYDKYVQGKTLQEILDDYEP